VRGVHPASLHTRTSAHEGLQPKDLSTTVDTSFGPARIVAHVFHRYGRPIKSLRRAWMRACRDAGRPGLLLHDLRRSAVRNLERAGISRSVAMKLTGHKTEAVYRRYAIVAESDVRDAGTKLAAMLGTTSNRVHSVKIPVTSQ